MKVKKLIVFGMTMMFVLASCNQHPSFSSSQEALDGCKKQLQLLQQKQDASIEELSSLTSTWLEVQDSAYSAFGRASSLNLKSPMAVAYFMAHAKPDNVLLPLLNQGESAVLFCFIFLFLVFAGAGAWSIDNRASK